MTERSYLAIDIGAESGRAMLGCLAGERLTLQEVHRFANGPVRIGESLHWDALRLWSEVQLGLRLAVSQAGTSLAALGLDTWGVDFGLLDKGGRLLGNPYHHRDSRTDGMLEAAFEFVPRHEIYAQTGIQFMQINSLYQLLAMRLSGDPTLDIAETFLGMPELFNYWLCGRAVAEFTSATTSQCYDTRNNTWAEDLLRALNLPTHIFPAVVQPFEVMDQLNPWVAQAAGCPRLPVVAVGSHDTASAVAAVPAHTPDFMYISSGTWSLMGIEVDRPIINSTSLAYNLTNEGGVSGTYRFLKNIMGLWLLQECRRQWARQGTRYSWDELTALAGQAEPLQAVIFPGDHSFLAPGDMPARIQVYCQEHRQPVPQTHAAIARCILESLALEYRWVANVLQEASGKALPVIHIIGGGSRNRLLNQLTADATGRGVIAGPAEATAAGNILAQAISQGDLSSIAEGRQLIRRSFEVSLYEPCPAAAWEAAYQRYVALRPAI